MRWSLATKVPEKVPFAQPACSRSKVYNTQTVTFRWTDSLLKFLPSSRPSLRFPSLNMVSNRRKGFIKTQAFVLFPKDVPVSFTYVNVLTIDSHCARDATAYYRIARNARMRRSKGSRFIL